MADPMMLLFDLPVLLIICILAYLSKRLGDAMKTAPYYLLLYVAAVLVVCACGLDMASSLFDVTISPIVGLVLRCGGGIMAVAIALRYWRWLFSEFFGI